MTPQMEVDMTNKLLLLMMATFLFTCGGAQASVTSIACSPMSKNPNCWDMGGNEETPFRCPTRFHCSQISSVIKSGNGSHACTGIGFETFDCTQLVLDYGLDIVGLGVLITQQYVDGCHKPGACGAKACMAHSVGFARLNALCK